MAFLRNLSYPLCLITSNMMMLCIRIVLMFSSCIVTCGTTHILELWTMWHPNYWLSGLIKAITALTSLSTAMLLVPLISKVLALPITAQLEATNRALQNEIKARKIAQETLRESEKQLQAILDHQELKALLENNPDIMARFDRNLRHVYINPAEEVLQRINEELELRVQKRTAELLQINELFLTEIFERLRVKVALRESEEKFRLIFNDAPIGIALARASDTQFVMVNPAFCKLLGYTESELLPLSCPVISYLEDLEKELPYAELMLTGESNGYQMEKRYIKKNGEIIWGNLTTTAIRNQTGEVLYVCGMVEEITERKQAQEALRLAHEKLELRVQERTAELAKVNASLQAEIAERKRTEVERERLLDQLAQERSQLEAIIRQMPGGVIVAEAPSGRLLLGNQQAAQIWCLPFGHFTDIEQHHEWKGFHANGQPYQPQEWPLSRSISKGEVVMNEEIEILRGDGTRGAIAVSSTPIRIKRSYPVRAALSEGVENHCENIIAGVVTFSDITDRKRAEREIKELNQNLERRVAERTAELEATNQELEAFSYSVSHDLRAPLRGIDGFSQAILERYTDKLDDKGKHYLQRIRANTQRMGELIDDLLKLSRVTRSEIRRTPVDLSALAQEIAAELQQTKPERQVEWAIAPGLVADGDARLLRVALENLLNNAWKFTSFRTPSRIEFNVLLQENSKFIYFVSDNGAGFDMANANQLFGAFHRLHTSTQFPGTGIGLATVQRIIHRHGGRVWAKGSIEQGATFYFTL